MDLLYRGRWNRRAERRRRGVPATRGDAATAWSAGSAAVSATDAETETEVASSKFEDLASVDPSPEGAIRLKAGASAIEEFFRQRYGREALYLPSNRFGLYLLFRNWLRPGDRLLMSPVDDDVVFFTVLAADLVPVIAPLDPRTGNINPEAVPESTWARLRGVLTTNLYGTPDRMEILDEQARRHDLLLIEDAAHAFDSRVGGRRIGTFGRASVFSLNKFIGIPGGVVTFAEDGERDLLARRALPELRRSPIFSRETPHRLGALLSGAGYPSRLMTWLGRMYERATPHQERRAGYRMRYTVAEVRQAQRAGGGLDAFDRWVRMDNLAFRAWPLAQSIRMSLHRLQAFEGVRHLRIEGARKLLDLGYTPPHVRLPTDTALLRVPLFVRDRKAAIARLAEHRWRVEYIYDPPIDVYAPDLVERLPSPPEARIWSRDVLPVNPLLADRFINLLKESPGLLEPLRNVD
jgi:hypothetical protein